MTDKKVVPDVIASAPKQKLKVFFESGAYASGGNKLTPTQVKSQPLVQWKAKVKKFYTVCMCDPDVKDKEWQHWLVGNVPGNNVCLGETITEYIGPIPAEKTGPHRYVILVYLQEKEIDFKEEKLNDYTIEGRPKFSVKNFAQKYNLGDPIAGNFYEAEYDDYVSILQQRLGIDPAATDKKKKKKPTKKK